MAPTLGGASRRLANVIAYRNSATCPAALSRDGRFVVYAWSGDLHIIGSDGSGDRKLVSLPDGRLNTIRWSPDSGKIRFSVYKSVPNGGGANSLWEVPVHGRRAVLVLPGWDIASGAWTPDRRYYLFRAIRDGNASIWARLERPGFFERAAGEPFLLTAGPMDVRAPIASLDGKRVFYIGQTNRFEFVRYDPRSGQSPALALNGLSGYELEYSKDGKWFAYVSLPERTVWRCASDATQCQQLTAPPLFAATPRWSPDGKTIAFSAAKVGSPLHIYLIPPSGGAPLQVTNGEGGPDGDSDPSWSPDGTSLAFAQLRGTSIQVLDVASKRVTKLPGSDGMWSPRWSPDGRFLVGHSTKLSELMLYDFTTRKQTKVFELSCDYPSWAQGGEILYFSSSNACWRMRMTDRKAEKVLDYAKYRIGAGLGWFALTPEHHIISTRDVGTQEVYALDWTEDGR
jgi:Tol biopolymer transport system component